MLEPLFERLATDLQGAHPEQVGIADLAIEQAIVPGVQLAAKRNQGNLAGVDAAAEHRFTEKYRIDGQTVNTAAKLALAPHLEQNGQTPFGASRCRPGAYPQ